MKEKRRSFVSIFLELDNDYLVEHVFFYVFTHRLALCVDQNMLDRYAAKLEANRDRRIDLEPAALRWTPMISSQMLLDEEFMTQLEVRWLLLVFLFRSRFLCLEILSCISQSNLFSYHTCTLQTFKMLWFWFVIQIIYSSAWLSLIRHGKKMRLLCDFSNDLPIFLCLLTNSLSFISLLLSYKLLVIFTFMYSPSNNTQITFDFCRYS